MLISSKSLVRYALGLCLLLSLLGTSFAQVGSVITTTQRINMRFGPGTNYQIIIALPANTNLAVDGRNFDGTWVRGVADNGRVGWIAAQFSNATRDGIMQLPEIAWDAPTSLSAPAGNSPSAPASGGNLPAPVSGGGAVSGFSYGGHIAYMDDFTQGLMQRAGMTWVKKQIRYQVGMDASGFVGMVNEYHGRGFRVLFGVVGDKSQQGAPDYNAQYANFVAGLASIGVDAIEVWNEPNIDREWTAGTIDGGAYTQLLAAAYNAIKSVNPNTYVISGAPAPTGFFGGGCSVNGCDDKIFLQQMAAAGAANYMDCVGVHYNEGIVPPTVTRGDPRSEFYTRYYPGMVDVYSGAFGGRLPLCFTELGYLTPEGFGALPGGFAWASNVTLAQHAQWLDQVVDIARNSGRVRILIIWNVNFSGGGDDPMGGFAILRPDGSCPACDALGN